MVELFSRDRTILEKGMMEFRPFGVDEEGRKIRDVSGVTVRANVECLEEVVARKEGPAAVEKPAEALCRCLNERIGDQAYHVTPKFLKNQWHSYSYEFVMFLAELCEVTSGDPQFQQKVGREKFLSPIIQVLGRPFSITQIYKMYPYFVEKFTKGALLAEAVAITDRSAVMRLKLTDRSIRQFGPYRYACCELICQSTQATIAAVPERMFGWTCATIMDRACMADGDESCEWEFTWEPLHGRARSYQRPLDAARTAPTAGRGREAAAPVPAGAPGYELLPKERRILERGMLAFRPFGEDEQGNKIRDASGVTVRANVEYLERVVTRAHGPDAAVQAVEELVRLLNGRIRDPAYHVTPEFLKNQWHSYSYEFVMFLGDLCTNLSGDPAFQFNLGRETLIHPIIKTLARPFSVSQTFKIFPYFGEKYAPGSLEFEVVKVADTSAVIRMRLTDTTRRQFGPYRRACADMICRSAKAGMAAIPEKIHDLSFARIKDRACMAEGDECCEWEFAWEPERTHRYRWTTAGVLLGGAAYVYLRVRHPSVMTVEALAVAMIPAIALWLADTKRVLHKDVAEQKLIVQEQLQSVEAKHEELREAYLEQEQTTVELRRTVNQLTALHRAAFIISSTLDRETLLQTALQSIVSDLHYDRAMISFYDRARQVLHDARILGVSPEIAAFARSNEVPVTDPNSVEGMVVLQEMPILVKDIGEMWDRIHPLNRQLATVTKAKTVISVPLKVKRRVIGILTVDRIQEGSLTKDDLNLMETVANQIAVALDNADAYRQIESLNVGLEAKVRERTAELERLNRDLEAANEKLKEVDRLKSLFLSHVSHELRTPLTSIKGLVENMLGGLVGRLVEKQEMYMTRVKVNMDRLIRMIVDLLDLSRIESGKLELSPTEVSLLKLVADAADQMRPLALAKRQTLEVQNPEPDLIVWADPDKVQQILTNLLDNAVKFTPEKGRITVRVGLDGPSFAKVSVLDTGVGIPSESLPRLFELFYQAGLGPGVERKGLGLGLSIVKNLVELHGGTVQVSSEAGKGSEFHCTFPVRRALERRRVERDGARTPAGSKRVLVVDDDPDIRQFLLDRLGSYGYVVETAVDGREALDALERGAFDGILLDIRMPELGGLEVLRHLRESRSMVPVVMITASEARERAIQAVSEGAQDFLLKPFEAAQLKQVVARWFGPAG
jgi:signal transduction histidine kinase